ncbi:meteorin-like protein isoform X2 [Nycticebus coucang]|uniref:meteorin-like protein isoform X2 n=1 Tax=Nycticebus coucang TaxID=9470 RepID=UPI00234C62BB|nr:meteorin-like protein isoform X2 [Nycticebus coucang]
MSRDPRQRTRGLQRLRRRRRRRGRAPAFGFSSVGGPGWAGGREGDAGGVRRDPPGLGGLLAWPCLVKVSAEWARTRGPGAKRSRSMRGAAWAAWGPPGQLWPRPPAPGPGPPPLLLLLLAALLGGADAQYSSDLCSWKGSGLTHEAHRKEVEQVYVRCAAGTVEWLYPTGALIVNLRPNTFSPARQLTVCIKPFRGSSGANIYLEKTGELKLLVQDGDSTGQVRCFGLEQGGLFVEATPQQDIGRRTTGFQYELTRKYRGPALHTPSALCRPCSDTEVLLAVCTSDFVVRGSIQDVTHEPELQETAIHLRVSRLYRQKSRIFQPVPEGGSHWQGHVRTLLECGVRPGRGDFLFTGHMRFEEAWLGCAPRFQDFQRMYRDAEERGLNPCEVGAE